MYEHLDTANRVYLIYCDISNYRHWVKEGTSVDKFFDNYDKLHNALLELTSINYDYQDPSPNDELKELQENEQKYICNFLSRAWIKTVSDAAKLKTDKGKANKIKVFFDSLERFEERFSEETMQILNTAKAEQPDFGLRKISKQEKDALFLVETEQLLDKQTTITSDIEQRKDSIAWFYQNNYLLSKIMREEIDYDIVCDIIRLMLAGLDHKKASRFLRVKYGLETKYGIQLYITASGIINSRNKILEYQSLAFEQYIIITHSSPCPICEKHKKQIYNISDAKIGENFPPFCRYNCSSAGVCERK